MSVPRFIYMRSDGLTSTVQIALQSVPNMDDLWIRYLLPFLQNKRSQTLEARFVSEEIMDFHECKFIRKVQFVYDDSLASQQMFRQLLQFENSELSILIKLIPSVPSALVPRLVDESTNEDISVYRLYYDEPSKVIRPYFNFKYLYTVQDQARPAEHLFLKPVNEQGVDVLIQVWNKMETYFDGAQADSALPLREKHELVDHVDCGKVLRFFFHYDKTRASLEMLYDILQTRREGTRHTLRLTLVPKTTETETLLAEIASPVHYPCLINAATQTEQILPLPFESYTAEAVASIFPLPPIRPLPEAVQEIMRSFY